MSTMPTRIMPKLKLCWVALAAFSPAERSFHGTNPSSLNGVTLRRRGPGAGVAPRLLCVAYWRERRRGRIEGAAARFAAGRSASIDVVAGFIMVVCRLPSYEDLRGP